MRITLMALISGLMKNRSLEKRKIGRVGFGPMRKRVVAKFSKESRKARIPALNRAGKR